MLTQSFKGILYSTLANVDVDGTRGLCQKYLIIPPKNWVIAEDTRDAQEVIASHSWSTSIVVVYSGNSYQSGVQGYNGVVYRYNTLQYRANDKSYGCYPCPCQILISTGTSNSSSTKHNTSITSAGRNSSLVMFWSTLISLLFICSLGPVIYFARKEVLRSNAAVARNQQIRNRPPARRMDTAVRLRRFFQGFFKRKSRMPTVIMRAHVHPDLPQQQPPPVLAEVRVLVQPRHRVAGECRESITGQAYLLQRGQGGVGSVVPYAQPVFDREGDDRYVEAQVRSTPKRNIPIYISRLAQMPRNGILHCPFRNERSRTSMNCARKTNPYQFYDGNSVSRNFECCKSGGAFC